MIQSPTLAPPQPAAPEYNVDQLYLQVGVAMSRATFQQQTGMQAPPFNPVLPVKTWYDQGLTHVTDFLVQYNKCVAVTGGPQMVQFELPVEFAAWPNLAGPYSYPPY